MAQVTAPNHNNRLCIQYLSGHKLVLTTSESFNFHLGQINSLKSLSLFINELSKSHESLSAKDKRTFLKNGLFELEKKSIPYLKQMDISTMEALLRLFTKNLHKGISAEFVDALQQSLPKNILKMKARNISALVYLVGKLSVRLSDELLEIVQLEAIKKIQDFNPQNMSNIVYGFSLVDFKPSSVFLKVWQVRYVQIYSEFENLNIVNSLFSFYLMGSFEIVKWFTSATPESRWASIKAVSEQRQISQVYEYYARVHKHSLSPIVMFEGVFSSLANKPEGPSSFFETQVALGLAMSGLDYEQEFKTKPGFYVDFYIEKLNRVLQVDGPGHFIKMFVDGQLLEKQRPQDLLIDEVLRAYGYEVRRQSYHQLDQ